MNRTRQRVTEVTVDVIDETQKLKPVSVFRLVYVMLCMWHAAEEAGAHVSRRDPRSERRLCYATE